MSYNNHKRFALDATKPFSHRASHARSCTVHVSSQLRLPREEVIQRVAALSGVDLHTVATDEELARALACLDSLRLPPLAVQRLTTRCSRPPGPGGSTLYRELDGGPGGG